MEHARWNAERFLAGWTLGPKDAENKVSPYLVPWEELPTEIKKYDFDAAHNIPVLLSMIGKRVCRQSAGRQGIEPSK